MTFSKRLFDLALLALFLPLLLPAIAMIALIILLFQGRPVFYVSERMKSVGTGFALLKFRTMSADPSDKGATGGHKACRVTPLGQLMRQWHIDELPQIWNILRGDMSFVGPRPPLRRYVDLRPDLYANVLKCRPGATGLATLAYIAEETRLLKNTRSATETERIYVTRCIPRKARLDLIYQRHQFVFLDLYIIVATLNRRMRAVPRKPIF